MLQKVLGVFIVLITFSVQCQEKEKDSTLSLAMQRFNGNDSDNELYTRFRYKPISGLGYEEGIHRR